MTPLSTNRLPSFMVSTLPNFIESLEDNIPLLGTLLVGFEGLLFVGVATSDHAFAKVVFSGIPFFSIEKDARSFLLTVSGIACALLYLSVISMVYCRMLRYQHLISYTEIASYVGDDPRRKELIETGIQSFDKKRFHLAIITLITFNTAVTLIPISVLVFSSNEIFSVGVDLLGIVWLLMMASLFRRRKFMPRLFVTPLDCGALTRQMSTQPDNANVAVDPRSHGNPAGV